ncbi:diaminopimelate decarboxylase [Micromonospora qiuiae]|uniref:Diaminopimelate decarboxylase n=1 Tax=Micromonospora qiuiae TaxID=502268 RepID=A0ABQ4JH04_9ACTN|nr:diaminopimelate decarboxylase [Micromonospora qiuiae]GIJ28766.1 diaminopimelate decarboxylase [Micromonospora qiuiae]
MTTQPDLIDTRTSPSGPTVQAPGWLSPPDHRALPTSLWAPSVHRDDDGVVRIGGVDVVALADRFGTPAYLFDEEAFRQQCELFRDAFQDVDVHYAAKAFLCKAVVRHVADTGLFLDVCTEGEVEVALAAGFPPGRMLLHGNNKSDRELELALTLDIRRVVVDSFDEIERLTALARRLGKRPGVLLRATVGVRSDAHDHNATAHEDQKFGFSVSAGEVHEAVRRVLAADVLDLRGLHSHIGSQILDSSGFEISARRAIGVLAELAAEHNRELPELNLGGGFGIAYTSKDHPLGPAALAAAIRAAVQEESSRLGLTPPRLAIEPGRAITGQAGCTLYRVGTVKPRQGLRTYVAVDGGMSDNIRPALFGADYTVTVGNRVSTAEQVLVRVVGRHCDAGDIVVRDAYLPGDVRVGDLLVVAATGAYCRSLSSNFNHTPRPPVIGIANGVARELIRRETVADLLALDVG